MDGLYRVMDVLLPFQMFKYGFMKNALLALLMLTPLLGLLGTMAVNKKMAFFSDALGHSALAGVGLGLLLGIRNETVSLIVFGILWALLISRINQKGKTGADTTISVFSSAGIALGLMILSRSGGFSKYNALLVGDVLAITPRDLLHLLLALVIGLILWGVIYNRLLLTAVSMPLARSRGIPARAVEYAFVCMVAVAVMLSIRWVGVLIGLVSGVGGLILAYRMDTGVGAAVVAVAAVCYFISLVPGLIRRGG